MDALPDHARFPPPSQDGGQVRLDLLAGVAVALPTLAALALHAPGDVTFAALVGLVGLAVLATGVSVERALRLQPAVVAAGTGVGTGVSDPS